MRLPAVVDRAVWEKITKGRIRWDNVVEKIWQDLGGDQEEVVSIEEFGGYKTVVQEIIGEENANTKDKLKEENHLREIRWVEGIYWNSTCLHSPMDYAKKLTRKS